MSRHRIEVVYAIETKGPLHVGTGQGAAGLNRAMLRDRDGLPYISGSTIKGRARFAAIRICDWMGMPVFKDAVADVRRGGAPSPNGPHGKPDLPARIFGHAWSRCTLRFSDARTAAPIADPALGPTELSVLRERAFGLREVRTAAARSRVLGTVSHGRLYRSEVAPPGLVFTGSIRGHLHCDDVQVSDFPYEILMLWLSLHLMIEDGIGGNKSSGNGKLAWSPSSGVTMKVDGAPFAPAEGDASEVLRLLPNLERERAGARA